MENGLAIDTTTDVLSLAAQRGGRPAALFYQACGRQANARILAEIDQLLTGEGLRLESLHYIGVVQGPGSFTGTRVGMAVALTLGQLLGKPVMGMSSLKLQALQPRVEEETPFWSLLHCGRNEVYHQRFVRERGQLHPASPIGMEFIDTLPELVGDDPAIWRSLPPNGPPPQLAALPPMALAHPLPDGALVLRDALARYQAQPQGPFERPLPVYLSSEVNRAWKS